MTVTMNGSSQSQDHIEKDTHTTHGGLWVIIIYFSTYTKVIIIGKLLFYWKRFYLQGYYNLKVIILLEIHKLHKAL